MQSIFKKETSFEKRVDLCNRIRSQYEDRIPIIVEVGPSNSKDFVLTRKKFLAPLEITIGGFLNEIRQQSTVRPEDAIFLFCGSNGGVLVPTSSVMAQVYDQYKDPDGFLYITVTLENTFGGLHIITEITTGLLDNILANSSRAAKTLGLHLLL